MNDLSQTRRLLLTTSMKGGGGKSTLAALLLDVLRSEGVQVAAWDADMSIGSLAQMHGSRDASGRLLQEQDPLWGVGLYNIRDNSRDELINSLGHPCPLLLHDIAGGALGEMERLFDEERSIAEFMETLRDLDVQPVFLHLITPDISTVASVRTWLDLCDALPAGGLSPSHIAVLNRHGGRRDADFPDWFGAVRADGQIQGGKTRSRLLAAGGLEISLPSLDAAVMQKVKLSNTRFSEAVTSPAFMLIEQQRVRKFLRQFTQELTPDVRQMLGAGA